MNTYDQDSDGESGDMSMPPIQSVEDFWGVELSSKNKKLQWETDDNNDEIDIDKTLELRQACLGASAKEGERNVVQITTENDEGEEVTHTILSMKLGLQEQSALFLTLRPPVVFELVSGSGPIHIVGNMTESFGPLLDDSDSESSEDEGEISSPEVKALQASATKKRPAESPAKKPASKIAKLDKEEDEMDTSEDEEEDESEEDDDDEDEDDEDEEEEETKPPPKKQQTNGKLKGKPAKAGEKGSTFKTPQVLSSKKTAVQQRGTQSAPTTPKLKGDKKKGGVPPAGKGTASPGVLSTDQIKQKLLKMSTNVPKKLEKFNNFLSNNFKVKDDVTKKHLWEFVQKNRAEK